MRRGKKMKVERKREDLCAVCVLCNSAIPNSFEKHDERINWIVVLLQVPSGGTNLFYEKKKYFTLYSGIKIQRPKRPEIDRQRAKFAIL